MGSELCPPALVRVPPVHVAFYCCNQTEPSQPLSYSPVPHGVGPPSSPPALSPQGNPASIAGGQVRQQAWRTTACIGLE